MYNAPPLPVIHNNTYRINPPESNAQRAAPIGIFDSGVGGLSVAIEIARLLPNEQILYYADTANVPYGERNDKEIRDLTARAIEWLYHKGCKLAVVACNSASAFSLDYLRNYYGDAFPIIGLVPALKPAVLHTQSKVVAVLATNATFRGKLIQDVIDNFAKPAQVNVLRITCPELVPFVEQGLQMSEQCLSILRTKLDPAIQQGADALVLGCTHYPFLKPAIQSLYQEQLSLIDSGVAVAHQTSRVLVQKELNQTFELVQDEIRLRCYVSGKNSQQLKPIVQRLIPTDLSWEILDVV
ncbi:MAG: glutamate racemase [Acinetobacter sp.]|nr:glutamate racemase [Acinetobacter sp.]